MKSPDDSRVLAPLSESSSHTDGSTRGEEFDLSQLDEEETQPVKSKWNRVWMAAAGLLALYCFYFWVYGLGVRAQKPLPLGPITAKTAKTTVRVHIAGAVKNPGVYALNADARVFDALQKAGGAMPNANPDALNLAAFVEDGAKIEVPLKAAPAPQVTPTPVVVVKEVPVPAASSSSRSPLSSSSSFSRPTSSTALSPRPSTSFDGGSSTTTGLGTTASTQVEPKHKDEAELKRHPVNLNTASVEELQRLPGVGPKMAERIIAYRQENGRFKSISDLDNVKGIGEKRMEKLGSLVVVK